MEILTIIGAITCAVMFWAVIAGLIHLIFWYIRINEMYLWYEANRIDLKMQFQRRPQQKEE